MNKAYLENFLSANEELSMKCINGLNNFRGSVEEKEVLLKEYSEVVKQHLAGIKQLSDVELAEENVVIEYEKLNVESENLKAQREQELKVEVANAAKEIVSELGRMIFYTARFREGLRYDIDNFVNDGFVRGHVQKLTDFIKTRK